MINLLLTFVHDMFFGYGNWKKFFTIPKDASSVVREAFFHFYGGSIEMSGQFESLKVLNNSKLPMTELA